MGESQHPRRSVYANINNQTSRLIVAYQRRPLSDVLFKWIMHALQGYTGDFWFALTVDSNRQPLLTSQLPGSIYIFKTKEDWRRNAERAVRDCIQNMNSLRLSVDADRFLKAANYFHEADLILTKTADICISFCLDRTGEVYVSIPRYNNPILETTSNNYASDCNIDFPRWVSDQAYFFLRDLCHTHQHHEPYSDTILILQDRDLADIQWRKNIVYSLYYAIIRSKRSLDTFANFQSLGILAYCVSFKLICSQRFGADIIENYNDESLKQSLETKVAELTLGSSIKSAKVSNIRGWTLAGLAIVIAILAILVQPRINEADRAHFPKLNMLSDFASKHFGTALFICIVMPLLFWVISTFAWMRKPQFGRDLLELANVERNTFAFIFVATGIFLYAATFYLFSGPGSILWNTVKELIAILFS